MLLPPYVACQRVPSDNKPLRIPDLDPLRWLKSAPCLVASFFIGLALNRHAGHGTVLVVKEHNAVFSQATETMIQTRPALGGFIEVSHG